MTLAGAACANRACLALCNSCRVARRFCRSATSEIGLSASCRCNADAGAVCINRRGGDLRRPNALPLQIDHDHAAERQQRRRRCWRRRAPRPARESPSASPPAARNTGNWRRARPAGATARWPSCHRRRGSARCRDRSRRPAPRCWRPPPAPARGRNGDSTSAPITMFQAETVSGLWRANSGFWTTLCARPCRRRRQGSAARPDRCCSPSPSPSAISPMPAKEIDGAEPGQPREALAEQHHGQRGGDDRIDVDDEARRAGRDRQLAEIEQHRVERRRRRCRRRRSARLRDHDGSAGRVTARKIAAGTAAMAKRMAPSSAGPNAVSPARIAGKADAQATTVTATAIAVVGVEWAGGGIADGMAVMEDLVELNAPRIGARRAD